MSEGYSNVMPTFSMKFHLISPIFVNGIIKWMELRKMRLNALKLVEKVPPSHIISQISTKNKELKKEIKKYS